MAIEPESERIRRTKELCSRMLAQNRGHHGIEGRLLAAPLVNNVFEVNSAPESGVGHNNPTLFRAVPAHAFLGPIPGEVALFESDAALARAEKPEYFVRPASLNHD